MLDGGLTRLIRVSARHTAGGGAWYWALIGVVAYLLRHSLRDEEPTRTVKVKRGHELTVSVREPDS